MMNAKTTQKPQTEVFATRIPTPLMDTIRHASTECDVSMRLLVEIALAHGLEIAKDQLLAIKKGQTVAA